MRTGMLALLGAATLVAGAPRASAQAQIVPVTGTVTQSVIGPGVIWFSGDVMHMREIPSLVAYALDYGADGTVDRMLYMLASINANLDAQTFTGPVMAFADVFGALGPNGLPDPTSYLTTVRVIADRQLVSMNPPEWTTEANVVVHLPSGEILKWNETYFYQDPFAMAHPGEMVGRSLMPGRK